MDVEAERQRIVDRIAAITTRLAELREELRDRRVADKQAADAARRRRQAIAADIDIDTTPSMQDALGAWYKRLP